MKQVIVPMILMAGGGATDISLYGANKSVDWNNSNHLYSRLIVAGGGGGADDGSTGGFGGGIQGENKNEGGGGTQTDGGYIDSNKQNVAGCGSFGKGGGLPNGYGPAVGFGGGGWYGGGSDDNGGGGGSGYVYTSTTAANYPSGCLLNNSYYLTNAQTIAGNQSFPSPTSNGNETGHSGNGYARITPVN